MRLRRITLQHFRNIAFADLEFSGRQQFLVGGNGQGKTALLEAAGYITALRSFRASDSRVLIAHGQAEAAVACRLEHEHFGETSVTARLRADGKDVQVDGERVQRLADYLGKFPTVVFSSQDQQLVRGAPAGRRRWLDLTLAATDASYLAALQTYARALAERNGLLKRGPGASTSDQLSAFEQVLAPAAAKLIELRTGGLHVLAGVLTQAYAEISAAAEPASFHYAPDFAEPTPAAILAMLEKNRTRDAQFRTTLTGPHRDDFAFVLNGYAAKDAASEGQQRSLVLALRLAQARWFQEKRGVKPVLLADDVLGELDPARRRRFWAAIDPELQVIATGTSPPESDLGAWQVFDVASGGFSPAKSPA
jgi:DNA replication and repair protein RecF